MARPLQLRSEAQVLKLDHPDGGRRTSMDNLLLPPERDRDSARSRTSMQISFQNASDENGFLSPVPKGVSSPRRPDESCQGGSSCEVRLRQEPQL